MLRKRNAMFALAALAGVITIATALPRAQMTAQPTAHHEMLLSGAGDWEGTLTTMMPGIPAEPVAATDTVEALGGFWTQAHFETEFMGMPYSGSGVLGYDTAKEKFVGTWIDSMTPNMAIMEGEYDESTRTLTMHWESPDMMGQPAKHRSDTVRSEDGNAYTQTFYMGEGDQAIKTMVIEMKRKLATPVEAGSGK